MTKRTDSHRPSAIVPADYSYVLSYHLATTVDGWPVAPFNIDAVIELQSSSSFAKTGSLGKCSVCGAHFIYGDIWRHDGGEHIHIGWECAEKYEMLVDRSAFELEASRRKATAAAKGLRTHNAQLRAAFLAEHAGLEEALKTPHDIVADIAARFVQWNTISDKQIALVMKLAAEAAAPQRKEIHVPAPTGRQTFRGVVVSTKSQEGGYGVEYKMTVKVTTAEGTWLAWGTIPNALLESVPVGEKGRIYTLRGLEVEITATLTRGKDEHFAIAKRPIGKVLSVIVQKEEDEEAAA